VDVVVGLDEPPATAALAQGRLAGLSFDDPERGVAEIASLHREHPLHAIVAVDDRGLLLAARASQALGLSGNPAESVAAAQNKRVFREILRSEGLAGPRFTSVPLAADGVVAAREARYPCVLKPLFLSAGRGVIRADTPEQFRAAFLRIGAILADPQVRARGGVLAEEVLVEDFIPGPEVSLEGVVVEGEFRLLAFLDKPDPLDGPYFEETLFVTPSRHPETVQRRALETVGWAVRALGLRTGPVHAELRLNGGAPVMLEVAARSIGGHCSRMLRFGTGLSLEELILRQAVGLAALQTEREAQAAGVMMIPIPAAGTLRGVRGLAAARRVPGIQGVEITIPVTQTVVPLPEGDRYLGFIYAKGTGPEAVEAALRAAHRCLKFDIRSLPVKLPAVPARRASSSGLP
jgi:biotin carboxylase